MGWKESKDDKKAREDLDAALKADTAAYKRMADRLKAAKKDNKKEQGK